jgi:tetratricopeptide (TPR) repeat protein
MPDQSDVHAATLITPSSPEAGKPADSEARPHIPGYEVLAELGRGGMGIVYQARQLNLGRCVALKMLLPGASADRESAARFRTEAEAVAHLQHPNIVQIYEVGDQGGRPFFTMEHIAGGSLARRLNGNPQSADAAAALVETLARAIHFAHQRGIIHRDLKPGNILLQMQNAECRMQNEKPDPAFCILHSAFCMPMITDFGLAKRMEGGAGLTQSGAIVGSPSYMAPEQASGDTRNVGPAADTYALGAILYEMLTGRPPFKAETPIDTVLQTLREDPVTPRRLQSKVPADLETICLKCLAKDPAKRYESALALAEDLRRFQDKKPIRARAAGPWERGRKWARRRPAAAALLLFGSVVALGLAAGAVWFAGHEQQRAREAEAREAEARRLKDRADRQRARAERNFRTALQNDIAVTHLADELKPIAGVQSDTVLKILARARANFERIRAGAGESPTLLQAQARMLNQFSAIYREMGRTRLAHDSARQAIEIGTRLNRAGKADAVNQANLADSREQLGLALVQEGYFTRALGAFQKALDLRSQRSAAEPANRTWQNALARSLTYIGMLRDMQGDQAGGEAALQRALRIRRSHPPEMGYGPEWQADLGVSYEKLGDYFFYRDLSKARDFYRAALQVYEGLTSAHRENASWQRLRLRAQVSLGQTEQQRGKTAQAQKVFTDALKAVQELAALDPRALEWRMLVLRCRLLCAYLHEAPGPEGYVHEAVPRLKVLEELLAITRQVVAQDRTNAWVQGDLANVLLQLGFTNYQLAESRYRPEECRAKAAKALMEALHITEDLRARDASAVVHAERSVLLHSLLGKVLRAQGRIGQALATNLAGHRLDLDCHERLAKLYPRSAHWQQKLKNAAIQAQQCVLKEAIPYYDSLGPKEAWLDELARVYVTLEQAYRLEGKQAAARKARARAQALQQRGHRPARSPGGQR